MANDSDKKTITAEEVANYVVCPEAWWLKYSSRNRGKTHSKRGEHGRKLRKQWVESQDLSSTLRSYAKVAYLLLVGLVIVVFLLEHRRTSSGPWKKSEKKSIVVSEDIATPDASSSFSEIIRRSQKTVPSEIFFLLLVLGLIIFMWDLFQRRSSKIRKDTGLSDATELISLRGSSQLPAREYSSSSLGLSSKPDALIKEDELIIPVDVKPMTNKVRDRHVIALMAHMRLIEDQENARPPYGILLLGDKKRLVKIKNSEEKQRWLDALLDEMRSIIEGVPAVPAPARYKCKFCDVKSICTHSAFKEH